MCEDIRIFACLIFLTLPYVRKFLRYVIFTVFVDDRLQAKN